MTKSGIFHTAAEYDTDLEKALYMGHQPEYRQPHIHEYKIFQAVYYYLLLLSDGLYLPKFPLF